MKNALSIIKNNASVVIAFSAILISLASFYATYLQAIAAEKQVKAMTFPLLDFGHGNYDNSINQLAINFNISNSGMGAAVIKDTKLLYKGVYHNSYMSFLKACCANEYNEYQKIIDSYQNGMLEVKEGALFSAPINNIIIPPQSEHTFFKLFKAPYSSELWTLLNKERWNLNLEVCYCTLLGDCFKTMNNVIAEPVDSCIAALKADS